MGDLRAVQDALNDGSFQWQRVEGDLVESARTWLDAASALRREGQHVSTVSILYRVTAGKAARTRGLAAQREATADAEGRRAMEAAGPTELDDAALETTQGTARRGGGRTATTTPFAPDESGPSGIRVVSPGGLTGGAQDREGVTRWRNLTGPTIRASAPPRGGAGGSQPRSLWALSH